MEISGLLSGRRGIQRRRRKMAGLMDLRNALGVAKKAKKHRKKRMTHAPVSRGVRALPGPTAERALEIAEKMLAEGKKPLAIAWARQAENKGRAAGKSAVIRRAHEIIKAVRGEAVLKTAAGFGDIEMIYMGRHLGLW
jgi:hypothetical protein